MNLPVTPTAQLAWKALRNLNGLFAVYKPSGLTPKTVKEMIQAALIEDLNKLKQRPQKALVKVVRDVARIGENPNALTAVQVPSYADHPLVRGPLYSAIKVAVVSGGLDLKMSGVMVLAVKYGTKEIDSYRASRMPKTYTVQGQFGIATDTHDAEGKIWQKSTFRHVTREKFDRVISNLQRSHQKVMFRKRQFFVESGSDVVNDIGMHFAAVCLYTAAASNSGVDIQSQEAYEMAVRGLLRPFGKDIPPLILNIKCLQFDPPEFELEIECIKESAQYLRKIVHDLAQDMKTCAVATHVRRTQDGPFTVDQALLRKHWTLPYISEALRTCRPLVRHKMADLRTQIEGVLVETR